MTTNQNAGYIGDADTFVDGYIDAALWSSLDDDCVPLDAGNYQLAPETLEMMRADALEFLHRYDAVIASEPNVRGRWSQAGHDLWLTRAGHGAGFWDGDWPVNGDRLTQACKTMGERWLYVGDDDLIYQD